MENEAVLRGIGVALGFFAYWFGVKPLARIIESRLQGWRRRRLPPAP